MVSAWSQHGLGCHMHPAEPDQVIVHSMLHMHLTRSGGGHAEIFAKTAGPNKSARSGIDLCWTKICYVKGTSCGKDKTMVFS